MSKKEPDFRPISHPDARDRLEADLATGRLYWDKQPIAIAYAFDFSNIKIIWKVMAAVVLVLGGLSTAVSGFTTWNKEYCAFRIGSCAPVEAKQALVGHKSRLAAFSLLFSPEETQSSSVASLQDALRILEGYPNSFAIIRLNTGDAQGPPQADQLALDRLNGVRAWLFECGVAPDRIRVELAASSPSHVADDQGASAAPYVPAIEIEIIAPRLQSS